MGEHCKGGELNLCPGCWTLICCLTLVTFGEFIGRTRLVIHYPSFVDLQYGMRIAHSIWQLGVGIILNLCR